MADLGVFMFGPAGMVCGRCPGAYWPTEGVPLAELLAFANRHEWAYHRPVPEWEKTRQKVAT